MTGLQNGRHPARADYDWRGFATLTRNGLANDGRGYRKLADVIGVTFTDLSRAASGQMIAVHKVFAICDWLKVDSRRFYLPPQSFPAVVNAQPTSTKSVCCSGSNVKHADERP